eukprot:363740-Chlamydomonas_euryale.AAC.21
MMGRHPVLIKQTVANTWQTNAPVPAQQDPTQAFSTARQQRSKVLLPRLADVTLQAEGMQGQSQAFVHKHKLSKLVLQDGHTIT